MHCNNAIDWIGAFNACDRSHWLFDHRLAAPLAAIGAARAVCWSRTMCCISRRLFISASGAGREGRLRVLPSAGCHSMALGRWGAGAGGNCPSHAGGGPAALTLRCRSARRLARGDATASTYLTSQFVSRPALRRAAGGRRTLLDQRAWQTPARQHGVSARLQWDKEAIRSTQARWEGWAAPSCSCTLLSGP